MARTLRHRKNKTTKRHHKNLKGKSAKIKRTRNFKKYSKKYDRAGNLSQDNEQRFRDSLANLGFENSEIDPIVARLRPIPFDSTAAMHRDLFNLFIMQRLNLLNDENVDQQLKKQLANEEIQRFLDMYNEMRDSEDQRGFRFYFGNEVIDSEEDF